MIDDRPTVRPSQRLFGETVYWITVLCAILCIIGPLITFVSIDNNVLNPHTLFGNIFDGMPTKAGVDVEEDITVGATVIKLKDVGGFEEGQTVTIQEKDSDIMETGVIASINENDSTITLEEGVKYSFTVKNEVQVAEETIWDNAKDNIEGGHYWIDNITKGDGFTLFGMFLGCSVGIIAMIITGIFLIIKEKSVGWGLGAFFIAFMSAISMIGLVSIH